MTEKKDLINKLGQVELTIHPVMIVLMKYTVRQLLRKVKSCDIKIAESVMVKLQRIQYDMI